MTNEEYGKIIARNLKRIAYEHHKSQIDIAKDLGLKQSTVSTWMNGTRVPRMPKIDMLCKYFNCSREEIMEEEPHSRTERVSEDEWKILHAFRSLNSTGKSAALSYMTVMSTMPDYKIEV